jgi:hypothetical protein
LVELGINLTGQADGGGKTRVRLFPLLFEGFYADKEIIDYPSAGICTLIKMKIIDGWLIAFRTSAAS